MEENMDRLSSLPNSLLSDIVSSLSFKEAGRTSVLSKSWLNIPKLTSNIEFDERFFVKLNQPDVQAQRRVFFDFINDWIVNHKEALVDKFSLRLMIPDISLEVIEQCTAFATEKGVKYLELDFTYPLWNKNYNVLYDCYEASVELPLNAYTNSIRYLKLFQCNFVESHLHNFHSLKEVSLGYMRIEMSALRTLFSSCKMLESLSLTKCFSFTKFDLGEECLGLRKLVIQNCHFNISKVFRVNTPNLKIFKFCGMMTVFAVEIRALALEEVELDFCGEYGYQKHGSFLYRLMIELYTARVLIVRSFLLQVIPTGALHQRVQRDMKAKHLIMKTALHENEFLGIIFMLNRCPLLECLTIEKDLEKYLLGFEPRLFNFNPDRFWVEKASVYKCMRSNLKKLEFKGFTGTRNEICLLRYFITRGKSLKKISVTILKDEVSSNNSIMAHRREMADLLLMFPKATIDLEISIY